MEPRNTLLFKVCVYHVARHLYENFPYPTDINAREFDQRALPEDASDEEVFRGITYDTVKWLEQEGFLRFEGEDMVGDFERVVLTKQGFKLLDDDLLVATGIATSKASLGQRLTDAIVSSGPKVAIETMAKIATELIKSMAT